MVAALSLIVPASLAWIGTWVINPMLGIIMFGMGLTLSPQDFKIVLSRPKDILIGCLTQFTVMPLLAWGLTWAFSLPQELAIGVILVGCCPGGTASNVITYLAKGDLALSVGMTAASTMLAPLLTPLLVWLLAGTMVNVHTTGMLLSIVYIRHNGQRAYNGYAAEHRVYRYSTHRLRAALSTVYSEDYAARYSLPACVLVYRGSNDRRHCCSA